MTRCAFLEWPEGLLPTSTAWDALRRQVVAAQADILITNEMPFGDWLPSAERLDRAAASKWIEQHDAGLAALSALGVPAVISSRPAWSGDRLVNEAFVLEGGKVRALHRKQFFPNEAGWYEANWFMADDSGFVLHDVAGLKTGVLLCTELMFNEYARHYGRAGADLIVVPRATGHDDHQWLTAGAMAAIVSGSYVISSNRVGRSAASPGFGGHGFACGPDGQILAKTSAEHPLMVIEVDAKMARRQKAEYPCYVIDKTDR